MKKFKLVYIQSGGSCEPTYNSKSSIVDFIRYLIGSLDSGSGITIHITRTK